MTPDLTTDSLAASASQGHLTIRGLVKRYGDHQAAAGVDLDIAPGELVVFLGPSGCGKTTILRCIAGLIDPSGGDIQIDGASIVATPTFRRSLGMVFQSYALFPHLSVEQNVAFGLRMRGVKGDAARRRVAEALALVDLSALGERMPSQLSGGQQQRVALARAIVTQPKVLLLDEPFSALDAKLRESVQVEVRSLVKRLGITTVLVTHDQAEAMAMADRIAVLDRGRVEQFDTPEAVYNTPRTLFVADFVGQINRLEGTLVSRGAGVAVLRLDGDGTEVGVRDNGAVSIGEPVDVVVRPEHVDFLPAGGRADGAAAGLRGTVRDIVFTGEKLSILVDTRCGRVAACRQNRADGGWHGIAEGCEIDLSWRALDMAMFPRGAASAAGAPAHAESLI